MMMPSLRPLWTWLAVRIPDRNFLVGKAAWQTSVDTCRRLIQDWNRRSAAVAQHKSPSPEALVDGAKGGDSGTVCACYTHHARGHSNSFLYQVSCQEYFMWVWK